MTSVDREKIIMASFRAEFEKIKKLPKEEYEVRLRDLKIKTKQKMNLAGIKYDKNFLKDV